MLRATWTALNGATQEVPFSFVSESETHGTMFTTLGKGGEHFHGPYVRVEESTKAHMVTVIYDGFSAPEWGVWQHDAEGQWTETSVSYGDFAHFYTGKVVASLSGGGGHAIRCQFVLNEPRAGFLQGGTGHCQISDRGRIDLDF
jgi:hypothetical protein